MICHVVVLPAEGKARQPLLRDPALHTPAPDLTQASDLAAYSSPQHSPRDRFSGTLEITASNTQAPNKGAVAMATSQFRLLMLQEVLHSQDV